MGEIPTLVNIRGTDNSSELHLNFTKFGFEYDDIIKIQNLIFESRNISLIDDSPVQISTHMPVIYPEYYKMSKYYKLKYQCMIFSKLIDICCLKIDMLKVCKNYADQRKMINVYYTLRKLCNITLRNLKEQMNELNHGNSHGTVK